jgi:hypothetical protein
MTNREKIIVGLMLVVVVYGVYTLFFSAPQKAATLKKSGANELTTLNAFITKVAEKTKTGFSEKQAYILKKAQAAWKQDPFVQIQPKKTQGQQDAGKPVVLKSDILYSGFLQMGDKRLAIINGMEYEAGDKLEPGGYIIRSILPNHVVIAPPGREKKTLILPMEENE